MENTNSNTDTNNNTNRKEGKQIKLTFSDNKKIMVMDYILLQCAWFACALSSNMIENTIKMNFPSKNIISYVTYLQKKRLNEKYEHLLDIIDIELGHFLMDKEYVNLAIKQHVSLSELTEIKCVDPNNKDLVTETILNAYINDVCNAKKGWIARIKYFVETSHFVGKLCWQKDVSSTNAEVNTKRVEILNRFNVPNKRQNPIAKKEFEEIIEYVEKTNSQGDGKHSFFMKDSKLCDLYVEYEKLGGALETWQSDAINTTKARILNNIVYSTDIEDGKDLSERVTMLYNQIVTRQHELNVKWQKESVKQRTITKTY